jgi:hypothetical protein
VERRWFSQKSSSLLIVRGSSRKHFECNAARRAMASFIHLCSRAHFLSRSVSLLAETRQARNIFLGSCLGRLLPLVPVTQGREQKDGRHAGQSASDKENAVGVNEAMRGAQPFDRSAREPLQDLS